MPLEEKESVQDKKESVSAPERAEVEAAQNMYRDTEIQPSANSGGNGTTNVDDSERRSSSEQNRGVQSLPKFEITDSNSTSQSHSPKQKDSSSQSSDSTDDDVHSGNPEGKSKETATQNPGEESSTGKNDKTQPAENKDGGDAKKSDPDPPEPSEKGPTRTPEQMADQIAQPGGYLQNHKIIREDLQRLSKMNPEKAEEYAKKVNEEMARRGMPFELVRGSSGQYNIRGARIRR